ncbi:helix-turn-helix domain-containing protein [Pseudozobellia thermophila]|uniref:AraC-type DNA-binding protein n=1 Tax=Pseudozobellia thermophila TaxID=192903 RepID=A0A1M6PIV8_9FLAO|nr:AraC family transcriptional regulator [Pseudozobellia thermophila]SHK07840.1 AraC-type DNA-binding protein [Pseudozobellia thermophila]
MGNGYDIAKRTPTFKKIEVSSLMFSEYRCAETKSIFTAWNHLNYFIYVLEGKKKWRTLENSYMVNANEVLFVKKGANIIEKYFDSDFCAIVIFIPDSYVKDFMSQKPEIGANLNSNLQSDSAIPVKMDRTLSTYFTSILDYFSNDEKPSKYLIEIKFQELLVNILSLPSNPEIGSYFKQIAQEVKPSIKNIMEANFVYNLSLVDFARLSHRSLSTFNRDFYSVYGMSPGKWLTKQRLIHAKLLLENTDRKVYEVAFDSGFESPAHFARVFKHENGISPLKFQKAQLSV